MHSAPKIGVLRVPDQKTIAFYCQGCCEFHVLNLDISVRDHWDFDGDYERPTITPNVYIQRLGHKCYCHISKGAIYYSVDSTHLYAGCKVPMN